jgi:signal transduction histidine kinase
MVYPSHGYAKGADFLMDQETNVPVAQQPSMPPPAVSGLGGVRRTLLVVDDEEGPREALRAIFDDHYRVLLADSGERALEILRAEPVDVAVVDVRMVGMSGLELLEKLKVLTPAVEVLVLTAYAALDTAQTALRLGAADYLSKPCDVVALMTAVGRLVERRIRSEQRTADLKRLDELQRELKDLRIREERLATHSEIYGGVLHDINKPLTVIVGLASLLNRQIRDVQRLEGKPLDTFRDRMETLARQADNVTVIVNRYLSLIRQGRAEINRASVNRLLVDLRDLLQAYPGMAQRRVAVSFLPDDVEVKAHSTDVIQMLLNLALNALQATTGIEGVEVTVDELVNAHDTMDEARKSSQWLMVSPESNPAAPHVAFRVRDRGPGIPPGVLEQLFETSATPAPPSGRHGLGLVFVKRLILVCRGAFTISTAPGEGTTVTLLVPISLEEPLSEGLGGALIA